MSRSNPNESLQNPASKFYKWDSDNACFSYFDKTLGEKDDKGKTKGQNVLIKLPFNFLVLDQLVCVRGYNEPAEKSYYSNEVRNVTTDIITVRSNKQIEKTGTYAEVKTLLGAKYCQSVYIGFRNTEKKLEIQNIQLTGAALNSWIEFIKGVKINDIAVTVKSAVKKKKGRNEYHEPVYTAVVIKPETDAEAIELDKQLQEYLNAYLAKNASVPAQPPTTTTPQTNEPVKNQTSNEKMDEEDTGFGGSNNSDDDSIPF